MCEIAFFVALFLLAFFGLSFAELGLSGENQFIIPFPVAVCALVVALLSVLAYFISPSQRLPQAAGIIYLSLLFTVGFLLVSTDPSRSPFIALWLLVSVFAGLFGFRMLLAIFGTVNIYLAMAFLIFHTINPGRDLIILLLAYELPFLVSWLIWHHKSKPEHEKDKAYNELVRELSQVANKSEIVINAIADGVIAVDSQGVVQLINPAAQRIIGWGKQDALKLDYKSVLKLLDIKEKALSDADDPVQEVLRKNTSVINNDLILETISGRKLFVSIVASPIGHIGAGVIIVFRDITQEKQAEREQAEFISTASHEMRTPVATIEGYLGLALNPNTATIDQKAQSYLIKAQESVRHLGQLFQDLLDISKVDDGRLKNNPKVIDLVAYVNEIVSTFQTRAKEKNLVLLFKPAVTSDMTRKLNPVYYVDVDNDHLREVISNLIENAIKYTIKGNITVDITGDNEKVTLSVHDTGIGIPPEDIPHLFQKFYRVDNSATQNIGGTGLGLYLSRRLVEAMDGRLWVESQPGEGSTFYVTLKRIDHEEATERIESYAEETEVAAPPVNK